MGRVVSLIRLSAYCAALCCAFVSTASAKPLLRGIRLPTLLLNAQNDPFFPPHALPHANELSAKVRAEYPHEGGHVGFVTGSLPGRLDWLPQRLLHFFNQHLLAEN